MAFMYQSGCGGRFLRNLAGICVVVLLVVLLVLLVYFDLFLLIRWTQTPAEDTKTAALPLDMASESIDDMFDGCRSAAASVIDLFGVFEWQVNINFSYAWALVETKAKKPVHQHLGEDHAIAMYIFTRYASIRNAFNRALKTGKDNYSTGRFRFHYFYYYLTGAVQALSKYPTSCRTVYHRTRERFDQNIVNTNVRFGAFTWAGSSKQSYESYSNISCFEIDTCFGGDITYYSSRKQQGQVLIPTYEVFKVTDVVTNDPWCRVVYKLQSTKTPRTDQNCKLFPNPTETPFIMKLVLWHGGNVFMLACFSLLMLTSFILVRRNHVWFVAAVMGTLLVFIIVAFILI